jgi:hypothetical protein
MNAPAYADQNTAISGLTIRNCSVYYNGSIYALESSPTITGNIFENTVDSGANYGVAFYGFSSSSIIEGNLFRNISCSAPAIVDFVNISSPIITNNIFVSNQCWAINMTLPDTAQPIVVNNTFVGNIGAIDIDRRVENNMHWYGNNLIVGNTTGVLTTAPGLANDNLSAIWGNNLVFNNGTNYLDTPDLTGQGGNISVDPLLVNPPTDLHLQPGSPAHHAGSLLHAPTTDFDGNPRTGLPDIGAYQLQGN